MQIAMHVTGPTDNVVYCTVVCPVFVDSVGPPLVYLAPLTTNAYWTRLSFLSFVVICVKEYTAT